MDEDSSNIPTVVITGFGLFNNHSENSSWLTVQELLKLDIKDYHIVSKEIPVAYEDVSKIVPELWKEHKPKLVVHCGMADGTRCLTLEQVAHNTCYCKPDICDQQPMNDLCCVDGPDKLSTGLDIQKILEDLKSSDVCVKAVSSDNAGRYLCEFTFYTSLSINKNTAFIHLPPVGEPYSASEMASTLDVIVRMMLKQVTS